MNDRYPDQENGPSYLGHSAATE